MKKTKIHYKREFDRAIRSMPPSGGGGCHARLLAVSYYGVRAGLSDQAIYVAIRRAIHGTRIVPDREIVEAVKKARISAGSIETGVAVVPKQNRGTSAKRVAGAKIVAQYYKKACAEYKRITDAIITNMSPVRIPAEPQDHAELLLTTLYEPLEFLYLGTAYGKRVMPVFEWLKEGRLYRYPHVIPNALAGVQGSTKDGKLSCRADSCVAEFRFAVVEFDSLSREEQLAFWLYSGIPVSALIDSGGKSIHGWVPVHMSDRDSWEKYVEGQMFPELAALGADVTCRNEARLSRLPGHYRAEKGRWQRLLYLTASPRGEALCKSSQA